jgi:hypothetical protein
MLLTGLIEDHGFAAAEPAGVKRIATEGAQGLGNAQSSPVASRRNGMHRLLKWATALSENVEGFNQ